MKGFEADWRDAYPGINAVSLMEIKNPPDPKRLDLIPVVKYAIERKIASGKQDYWDAPAKLELAILLKDEKTAKKALSDALSSARVPWELETTARNLRLIRDKRTGISDQQIRITSSLLAGIVVILTSLIQLLKSHETWVIYRATANSMLGEKYMFTHNAGLYSTLPEDKRKSVFVERVEGIIAQEGTKYFSIHSQKSGTETAIPSSGNK